MLLGTCGDTCWEAGPEEEDRMKRKTTKERMRRPATKTIQNPIPKDPELAGAVVGSTSITLRDRLMVTCGAEGTSLVLVMVWRGSYVIFSSGSKIKASPGPDAGGLVLTMVPAMDGSVAAPVAGPRCGSKARRDDSLSVDMCISCMRLFFL